MKKDGINIIVTFEDKKVFCEEQCYCQLELFLALANLKNENNYSSDNISKDDYNYVKKRIKTCFDLIDYARKNKKF